MVYGPKFTVYFALKVTDGARGASDRKIGLSFSLVRQRFARSLKGSINIGLYIFLVPPSVS